MNDNWMKNIINVVDEDWRFRTNYFFTSDLYMYIRIRFITHYYKSLDESSLSDHPVCLINYLKTTNASLLIV